MREITEIVVHHSAVPRDIPMENLLKSFNRTHKERLYKVYGQPVSTGMYPHVAYHYIVASDSYTAVRGHEFVGYHASNINANKRSIAICLNGNFDKEDPNEYQLDILDKIVRDLKKQYPSIEKVSGHRDYANKTCPGKRFKQSWIDDLNSIFLRKPMNDEYFRSELVSNSKEWDRLEAIKRAITAMQGRLHGDSEEIRSFGFKI